MRGDLIGAMAIQGLSNILYKASRPAMKKRMLRSRT